jgi:hypothetical protein
LNLDKEVNKLIDRIDKLDSSNNNKSDGINYWKGKKIISLEEWLQISRTNNLSNPDKHRIKEGLEYFPNGYCDMIFPLGVPDDIIENVNEWHKDYIELMDYTRNEDLGKRKCRDCLLSPNNKDSYFGLYKFIANALEVEVSNSYETSLYPCKVVNFFSCPFDNDHTEVKEEGTISRNDLFSLNQITEIIGRALSKALNIKGNRIIYKIDFQSGKVQEIDTFLYRDPNIKRVVEIRSDYEPIEYDLIEILNKIEKLTVLPMSDMDDIFAILTEKEKMDTVFQIGLDKEYIEHKDELIEFFISIKGNVKREDLCIRHILSHYVEREKCSLCSQPAKINCVNCSDMDIWLCIDHLKTHKTIHANSIIPQ